MPDGPRGFVLDLRLRWAWKEAGLSYNIETVPFEDREHSQDEKHQLEQAVLKTEWQHQAGLPRRALLTARCVAFRYR